MQQQAIESFRRLGYTAQEAHFLYLAAVHSGYFVRRQYAQFVACDGGGTVARFLDKLVAKGHARAIRYWSNRLIFHIRDYRLYARIDQVDNRNRRTKAPVTIQRRLMGLDFVLAHQEHRILAGSREKFAYFSGERRVPEEKLPARRYPSARPEEPTRSYFVEQAPIYISGHPSPGQEPSAAASPAPLVHFAYLDEGARTLGGLEAFLRLYHPLFVALGAFEVIYVAANPARIDKAGRLFGGFYPADGTTTLGTLRAEDLRMVQFFALRCQWEQRDYRGFGADGLVHFREERQHFSGAAFDNLYRQWREQGDAAFRRQLATPNPLVARFRTLILPHNYELFGSLSCAA